MTISKLIFRNGSVSVGDVFASSWGHEQTNVNFYQVIALQGKKTVIVREIKTEIRTTQSMAGYKKPVINNFIGEPIRRQINENSSEPLIKIDDCEWDRFTTREKEHCYSSWY